MFDSGLIDTPHGPHVVPPEYRVSNLWEKFQEMGFLEFWKTFFRCNSFTMKIDCAFWLFLVRVNQGAISCYADNWHKYMFFIICLIVFYVFGGN